MTRLVAKPSKSLLDFLDQSTSYQHLRLKNVRVLTDITINLNCSCNVSKKKSDKIMSESCGRTRFKVVVNNGGSDLIEVLESINNLHDDGASLFL